MAPNRGPTVKAAAKARPTTIMPRVRREDEVISETIDELTFTLPGGRVKVERIDEWLLKEGKLEIQCSLWERRANW